MKMLRYSIGCLSAALLGALVAGCDDTDMFGRGQVPMEITADAGSPPSSRSQIDTDSESGLTGILWTPGDRIGVFGATTANAVFTSGNKTPAATATFSGNMDSGDAPRYAYYPYAEGTDVSASRVTVNIGSEQSYTGAASISANDIKVSASPAKRDGAWHFTFRPVVAMLHFTVDARGLEGIGASEKLTAIRVQAAETAAESAPWTGAFTLDLTATDTQLVPVDGKASTGLVVNLPDKPTLAATVEAYASVAPSIGQGQTLQIYLATDKHRISFRVTAEQDLQAGGCYTVPLTLSKATADNNLLIEDIGDYEEPQLLSFGFLAADNKGKILDTEAYYDPNKGTETRPVTGQTLAVSETDEAGNRQEKGSVTGCIPYLYDFNLKPVFTVTDGATVTVNGTQQVSGTSVQDFNSPVTYTVTNKAGTLSRDYVVTVTNTGLPVVVLTGGGQSEYPNEDRDYLGTTVRSKNSEFVNTDRIAVYDKEGDNGLPEVACGFRLRGNSTKDYPKRPMAIKLDKKAAILGMPRHKRWCLLASWIDRSLIRNAVAFDIAHKIQDAFPSTPDENDYYGSDGTDGLVWNPSGRNVELVLNGVHVGNYFLCEQIKIDENRLKIQDCFEDVKSPTTANCGYLLEFDDLFDEKTTYRTQKAFLPCMSKDEITDKSIWEYVTGYVQDIEDKLWAGNYSAAYEKLDINSVIDYWFVQELTMNDEFKHPKSVYMYKNGTGKLFAGPVWDFDWQTFPNIANIKNYGSSYYIPDYDMSTLLYTLGKYATNESQVRSDRPYMWYPLLFKDATFKTRVKERWAVVYPLLSAVVNTIGELGEENKCSDSYNRTMWPIESFERKNWYLSVAFSGDERLGSYDEVIAQMQRIYQERLTNMNTAISNLK